MALAQKKQRNPTKKAFFQSSNISMETFMSDRNLFKTSIKLIAIASVLASANLPSWAAEADKAEPLELRTIMHELGKNMQTITDGISNEDWDKVANVAPLIAEHPQPSMTEKARILTFLGADAGKFKGHDDETGLAAQALEQAAMQHDGQAVIASFAKLQSTCLACHQSFRKPLIEQFYQER